MFRKPATAFAATMPALFADHATAQAVGAERAELASRLEEGYAETRRSLGVACNGTIFDVLSSAKETWSLPVAHPQGRSRLVATGQAWQNRPLAGAGFGGLITLGWRLRMPHAPEKIQSGSIA